MNKLEGYELITKENKDLKARIEKLEKENRELRKSVNLLSSLIKNSNESALSPSLILSDDSRSDTSDCEVSSTASNGFSQSHKSSDYILQSSVKIRDSAIHCARFSDCGKFIGVGSSDCIITFFECSNRIQTKSLNQLIGHNHIISDLVWDNSSTTLFSCSYDHTVKIWDIGSKNLITSIKLKSALNSIILDPNNNNVIYTCGCDKQINGIDKRSSKIIFQLPNDSFLTSIKPSSDEYTFITGDMGGMLKFWDVRGQMIKKEFTTKTSCSAISCIGIIMDDDNNSIINGSGSGSGSGSSNESSSNNINNNNNNIEDNNNNSSSFNNNIIITNHYNGSSNIYRYNLSNDVNNLDKTSYIKHCYTLKPSQALNGFQTKCAVSQRNNNMNINNNNNNSNNNKDNLNDNNSEDSDGSDYHYHHHVYDKNVAITSNDGSITMYSYIPPSEYNNNNNSNNNNLTSSQQQLLYHRHQQQQQQQQQSMILSHSVKIDCHKRAVTCVDFHPVNNNTFLTGSLDSYIKLWYKSI